MKKNNKGYTLVEVIVSFSLIMIVMIYLLKTIIVISQKNSELLIMQEYIVFENTLLNKIYDDISKESDLTIIDDASSKTITFDQLNKSLKFDLDSIIYDDIVYDLPDNVTFKSTPYNIITGQDNKYYVININFQINKKDENMKIIYQK